MYSLQQDQNVFIHNPRHSWGSQQSNNQLSPISIDPSQVQNGFQESWLSTSLDSSTSFGQSPVFDARHLLVTPSTSSGLIAAGDDDDQGQKAHQELFEKRRRRRESHNAVERRRRDNINDRIQELSTLLPDHLVDSVPVSANVITVTTGQSGTNGKPINKGTILKLSIDYIKELREEVSSNKSRIQELEQMVENARRNKQQINNPGISYQHERVGSMQFQQQFGNLHITPEERR